MKVFVLVMLAVLSCTSSNPINKSHREKRQGELPKRPREVLEEILLQALRDLEQCETGCGGPGTCQLNSPGDAYVCQSQSEKHHGWQGNSVREVLEIFLQDQSDLMQCEADCGGPGTCQLNPQGDAYVCRSLVGKRHRRLWDEFLIQALGDLDQCETDCGGPGTCQLNSPADVYVCKITAIEEDDLQLRQEEATGIREVQALDKEDPFKQLKRMKIPAGR